ncbi:uncharacterized protein LOC107809691 [Nicotiana tabacum]|uniref:ATP-dependent DNA helicase n=1 Tax=Nicotiana tabacum TaxID=4097 RepID=A0A1S4BLS4_TOBAC|nr:PREDICTED: uncharacterized protein LOC107809691 [Nicotiana tabacum]
MNRTNAEAMKLNLLYREFPQHFVWSATERKWTPRKQRYAIGRVVTCHPTEGKRYYLRMLLMTIRGPKSYNDFLTVNGERCRTFRESVEKRGLLQSDNSLLECMSEATSYQMPYSLRRLFATLLIYCNPTNPRQLWEQFEEHMFEDYMLVPNIQKNNIRYRVLNHINDILHSMGGDINEYQLIPETIRPSVAAKEAKELKAYNIIIERIFSNKAGAFFIDGPGGTGKTFLYRALLATVRSKRYIALATSTSGVAASILPGGRTAHSRFKIPINTDENVTCNISKQSSLACLIQDAKLIIWDEVSMAKKRTIKLLDLLLKDLMDSTILFSGKFVVFGGDFRQTLPVIRNEKKEDFINECLLYSHIWEELERLRLFENIRAKDDPSFCNYLLRIGNGEEKINSTNKIEIPTSLIIPYTTEKESLDKLFAITYPDVHTFFSSSSYTSSRVILTTKNDFVDDINDMLVARFPEESKAFIGIDETIEPHDQSQFEDLLHSLNPPAQGQTLDFVGVYLREPVFSHGQLYVALSRAKSSNCVKVLIRPTIPGREDDHYTDNIVYKEIIEKATL